MKHRYLSTASARLALALFALVLLAGTACSSGSNMRQASWQTSGKCPAPSR